MTNTNQSGQASGTGIGNELRVSFEFSPPRTPEMEAPLWQAIKRLEPLEPAFVSVTYGAGGSTRERTHATVKRILEETRLVPAAHLTCVGATREEIDEIADDYWQAGVRHLVAIRGDPPNGESQYEPYPGGYAYAVDLVEGLRRRHDFEISVSAFPELHPESPNLSVELDNLKRKVDAGASRAITQFFYENELFFRFREEAAAAGISVPILPGIMPIVNIKQQVRFAEKAGASVPAFVRDAFEGLDDDVETRKLVAVHLAAEQVRGLVAEGVRDIHFYTMNRSDLTYALCYILGIRPRHATPLGGGAR